MLNSLFILGQQTFPSGGANSGEIFEVYKQPVCNCILCLNENNIWVFILVIVLLFVLLNLVISLLKYKFYIIRNKK